MYQSQPTIFFKNIAEQICLLSSPRLQETQEEQHSELNNIQQYKTDTHSNLLINLMELQLCQHEQSIGQNCRACGVYVSGLICGLKSTQFFSAEPLNSQTALKAIRKRAAKFQLSDTSVPNLNLNNFLTGIACKFRFSYETQALGLYFFYGVVIKRITFSYNQLLYGSVCLLLAAKSLEKDPLVPRMSALRKAACSYIAIKQYNQAERIILQILQYDLDVCTFATFIDFYLVGGVFFNNELTDSFDVTRLENIIVAKMNEFIKSARFMNYQPEKLAVYIVGRAREQLGLVAWSQHMEESGRLKCVDVAKILKELECLQRPQVVPLQFRSVSMIITRDFPLNKISLRANSKQTVRDERKISLTIITNDSTRRNAISVAVL